MTKIKSTKIKFIYLFLLLLVLVLLSIGLGSVIIPVDKLAEVLFKRESHSVYYSLIWEYRIPKMISLILTGIALGLSGLFMQSLFRNSIVGPYVLGLSSGAGLFVAVVILGASVFGWQLGSISLSMAAAIGSVLTLLLILGFYYKVKNVVSLLIIGLMVGIFSGALIQILSFFGSAEALQKYIFWAMGNPGNLSWSQIFFFFVSVFFFSMLSISLIKPLNALLMGENYAVAMGFSLRKNQLIIILTAGILTGVVTALVGPVAFVGLMVPHIVRKIFHTQLHEILIPGVMIAGPALLLACDIIAQWPGSHLSLPLNGVTALLGAPLVIYMIYKQS